MAKSVKIVVWVLVFALAAGAGAYMASRANPFPPGVEDPGARPTSSAPAGPEVWRFVMTSRTWHELHQGGDCRSDWRAKGSIVVRPNGEASGTAIARVLPGAGCTFPQSQVQLKVVQLDATGTQQGATLRLSFEEVASSPVGAQDLGGFVETLPVLNALVKLGSSTGHGFAKASKPDGDLGSYGSKHELQLMLQ